MGEYDPKEASIELEKQEMAAPTAQEKKAMKMAGLTFLAVVGVLALTVVPESGILRHPETGAVAGSPFLKGIVAFIFISFALPGFVYGRIAGTMKNDRDIIDAMSKSMGSMGLYITLVFFAAQFVAFFKMDKSGYGFGS